MKQETWSSLTDVLHKWQQEKAIDPDEAKGSWLHKVCSDFSYLLDQAQANHQEYTMSELAVAIALLILLPANVLSEQDQLHEQIERIILAINMETGTRFVEHYLELTIAWGCGWRPRSIHHRGEKWKNSLLALRSMVEASISETYRQVHEVLTDTREFLPMEHRREFADLIMLELVYSRCQCEKHQRPCQGANQVTICSCCRYDHRLLNWDPGKTTLQGFVAQAVRGSADSTIKGGAFVMSMLYKYLNEDTGIRIDQVEFKVCSQCHPEVSQKARQGLETRISELKDLATKIVTGCFEGSHCPVCKTTANSKTTYYLPRKNWFLIPYDRDGAYIRQERWRCKSCANLFSSSLTDCPLCGTPRPQRTTEVWIYSSLSLRRHGPDYSGASSDANWWSDGK